MKRKSISLLYLLLFAVFILHSCGKDEVPELTEYELPQTIIKGKVFADLDVSPSSPGFEFAPSGTRVKLKVSVQEYGIDPGNSLNPHKTFQTTVSSTGDYSFSIDATTSGVRVYVDIVQFEYMQYQGKDINNQSITVRRIYYINPVSVIAFSGQTHFLDLYLSNN